jgi:hypothetical protein
MTAEQADLIRRNGRIETELRILEAIPAHSYSGAISPNLLGSVIARECIDNIRAELGTPA